MTEPVQPWPAPSPDSLIEAQTTNWLLTTLAGLVAGLVAAGLYAVISVAIEREILYLIIGVGAVVGLVVMAVAKVDTVATGLLSVVIAAVSLAVAIFLYITSLAWGSFGEALSHLGDNNVSVVFDSYFSDPLGYVWVFAGLASAYYCGSGLSKKGKTKSPAPAIATQMGQQDNPPRADIPN